jgi:hypothetical protein
MASRTRHVRFVARDIAGRERLWARLCPATIGSGEFIISFCAGSRIRFLRQGVDVFVIIETHWRHEDSHMKSWEGSLVKSVCCSMVSSVKIEPREPERRGKMHQMVVTLVFL